MKVFHFSQKVYFGDTDAAGIVYHGRYVYWMEAARIEMLESMGCPYTQFQAQKIGFIPVDLQVSFKQPLRFGDRFEVQTRVVGLSKASLEIENQFFKGEQLVAIGKVRLACLDEVTWKPRALPEGLISAANA